MKIQKGLIYENAFESVVCELAAISSEGDEFNTYKIPPLRPVLKR